MSDVTFECKQCMSIITIENPPKNFIDQEVIAKLNHTVHDLLRNETELRVALITAAGEHFSGGIDYRVFTKMNMEEARRLAEAGWRLMKQIEDLPVPVIAAVKGETTGAGLGLALAADIRIASSDAVFSFPEALYGVPPIFGSSQRLAKTVGMGRAKELLFTGRSVDADEALAIGLVNKVVPVDGLDDEAKRIAARIGQNSLSSLRAIKMLVNTGLAEGYDAGLKQEITAFSEAFNPDTGQWERR